MYLIDSTNNLYFQSLAKYIQERVGGEITDDYTKEGVWILNYVSFKNGVRMKDYIVVQTEQMEVKGTPDYKLFLANAKEVWDWTDNFKIGYADAWRLEMEEAKDIDVLFFGAVNERRKYILDQTPSVTVLTNTYGAELQSYVMRSKIVLSIHHYDNPMNDMPRIAPLLSNRAFVIAEKCNEEWFNEIPQIAIYEAEKIPSMVDFYLKNPLQRLYYIDAGYEFIKNFNVPFKLKQFNYTVSDTSV